MDLIEHNEKLKFSSNGLVIYTGFHRCSTGILEVTELYIDNDIKVRSYKELKLPTMNFRPKKQDLGLPKPGKRSDTEMNRILIHNLPEIKDLRISIIDRGLNTVIEIGDFTNEENIISALTSDLGTISLQFYPSDISYTAAFENWLIIFVNALETLLPPKLGLIVDLLIYILRNRESYPTDFDIRLVRTLLASHEIYFENTSPHRIDELEAYLGKKYEQKDVELMLSLVTAIDENFGVPMIKFANTHHKDLSHLMHLFLIMELEEIIQIYRPGIIDV